MAGDDFDDLEYELAQLESEFGKESRASDNGRANIGSTNCVSSEISSLRRRGAGTRSTSVPHRDSWPKAQIQPSTISINLAPLFNRIRQHAPLQVAHLVPWSLCASASPPLSLVRIVARMLWLPTEQHRLVNYVFARYGYWWTPIQPGSAKQSSNLPRILQAVHRTI